MYITMLRRMTYIASISISLASCGGTATDSSSVSEYLNALSDIPESQQDNNTIISDLLAPTTPENLRTASAPQTTQISLIWDASTDDNAVAGYLVYKDNTFVASTAATTYIDTDVRPDTTYIYHVVAVDAANNQASSNHLYVNTPTVAVVDSLPPSVPGEIQFSSVTSSGLTISWSESSDDVGLAGYRVYRNGNLVSNTQSLSFNDSGLSASTGYSYVIQAYDNSNNTASSTAQNITTQAAASVQAVTVSWQDPTRNTDDSCIDQLQGYTLYYGTSSGSYDQSVNLQLANGDVSCTQTGYDNACSTSVMTCSYVTEQLPANTWYFAIQTYDIQGGLSAYSDEVIKVIN